ncbi:OmpA family protein [Gangjinia marincola]
MKFSTYILLIVLLFSAFTVSAQRDKIKKADAKFNEYAFIDAREIYLEVANSGFKSVNLFKKLGDSYYFNGKFREAAKWYGELFKLDNSPEKEYLFKYAISLKSVQKYEESDKIMAKFENLQDTDRRAELFQKERNYLELIEMQSGKFDLKQVDINSRLSDFSPTFFGDKLVFSSNREVASTSKRVHEWNEQGFLDLYYSERSEDNSLSEDVAEFPGDVNSKFHESSAVFTKDGNTIYFTRNNYDGKLQRNDAGFNFLKIYRIKRKEGGKWQNPVELPFNSQDYNVAHPALNADETKLYFSSDMPGSLGQSDIFVVDIAEDGSFGTPKNLGDAINTEGKETFPFVSSTNDLYFSSDGHTGLGGLDIFVASVDDEGNFDEVYNVGRPVNSPKDDFSFIIDKETNLGYFASNREGGLGEDDIYGFKQKEVLIKECNQYLSGTVTDPDSDEVVAAATVELYDEELNLISSMITDENGFYEFKLECDKNYIIRVVKEGFETKEEIIETTNEFERKFFVPIDMKRGSDLGVTTARPGDDLFKLLQLDPIYFDFNKSNIRPDAEVELQKIIAVLRSYPRMQIDVRSHTDSKGYIGYNEDLSNRRAKSTINYMVEKGIDRSRLSGRGYGEAQLVNECSDGVDCTEDQHQKNRRSEFIITNDDNEFDVSKATEIVNEVIVNQGTPVETENTSQPSATIDPVVKNDIPVVEVNTSISQKDQPVTQTETTPVQPVETVNPNDRYNFSSSNTKEIFTVQIAAIGKRSTNQFDYLGNVFNHQYQDGFNRYFSGTFATREEANNYKLQLKDQGLSDVFVVGLRGLERF